MAKTAVRDLRPGDTIDMASTGYVYTDERIKRPVGSDWTDWTDAYRVDGLVTIASIEPFSKPCYSGMKVRSQRGYRLTFTGGEVIEVGSQCRFTVVV